MVLLLREVRLVVKHVDVLEGLAMRGRIKKVAQWPTFPQIFAHRQLIGGLDIAREIGTLARSFAK